MTLLRTLEDDKTHREGRKLNMKYPKRVTKYKKEVLEKFSQQKIFRAMDKLKKKLKKRARQRGMRTEKMQHTYDSIDLKAFSIMLQA